MDEPRTHCVCVFDVLFDNCRRALCYFVIVGADRGCSESWLLL